MTITDRLGFFLLAKDGSNAMNGSHLENKKTKVGEWSHKG